MAAAAPTAEAGDRTSNPLGGLGGTGDGADAGAPLALQVELPPGDDDEALADADIQQSQDESELPRVMSPSILKPGIGPVVAKGSPRLSFADRGAQGTALADIREYQCVPAFAARSFAAPDL